MPMTNAQIEKKLPQHDNEIVAIYDMLTAIRGAVDRHTTQLSGIQRRLDAHDARFDAHDARFDAVDGALAEILRRLPEAS